MSSFTKGLAVGALVAGSAGVIYYFSSVRPAGGDEQPPIIVGDGSVDVYAAYDPHGHGRGQFNAANPHKYQYQHIGGQPTNSIDVVLLDGLTSADCMNADQPFRNIRQLNVHYMPPGSDLTVLFDNTQPPPQRLTFTFADTLGVTLYKPYWLRVPNGGSTYLLNSVEIIPVTGGSTTCGLQSTSSIEIIQRQ